MRWLSEAVTAAAHVRADAGVRTRSCSQIVLWSDFALQFDERRMKVFSVGQAEGPDGCAVAALHQFEQRANARERERESETSETAADRPRKIERE